MADKRELELEVKVDDKGSRPLKKIGDQAEDTAKDFEETNAGLKKLDDKMAEATKTIAGLRKEIARTGDLDLIKDITKQEQRIKALTKQRKTLLGPEEIIGDAAEVGVSVGARIGPFLVQGMSRAMAGVGPAAAIGAPLVAGLVTFLGTAAAGGMLGGAVVGAVAGGIKISAQDPRVKVAAKTLGDELLGELQTAAGAFVPATLEAMDIVRSEVKSIGPELRRTFNAGARYVEPLTRGVTGLVKNALPGLRKGIEAAGPVVDSISRGLPRIGAAIGDVFGDLADNADEAGRALDFVFGIIDVGVRGAGKMVDILATTWGWLDRIGAAMSGDWGRLASLINSQEQAKNGAQGLLDSWRALAQADPGTEALWQRQVLLNKSMADGIKQAGDLKKALDLLNGGTLSAREAERGYQAAIDAVTASIKENGKSLDAGTEKGRANQEALDALAAAGAARAQTIYDQTIATKGTVVAENAAINAYKQGRAQLFQSAMQLYRNEAAAWAYVNSVMAIPRNWKTTVVLAGASEAIARANAIQAAIKRITGKTVRIGVTGGRGGHLEGMSTGGPVEGPGPKGIDSVPKMLAKGEHVMTSQEVDAAGGHRAVEAWRRSLLSGRPPAMSGGGAGRSGGGRAVIELRADPSRTTQLAMLLFEMLFSEVNRRGGLNMAFRGAL